MSAHQIENRLSGGCNQARSLRRRLLREHYAFTPLQHVLPRFGKQPADMGKAIDNIAAITAINGFELNMRVEDADVLALPRPLLDGGNDGTFAQIVRILLEGEAEHADALR